MTWQLASFLILGLALALGFAWYERSRPPARVLALVAALAALAVVGRLAFAPLPNVKPTTDIVFFAGYALGGAPGFAVGAVTALVSNVFLSHGPWTPWQMVGWGGVGIAGGALGAVVRGWRWRGRRSESPAASEPRELGRWPLALACGLAGLGFGIVMDVYMWTLAAEQTFASYVAVAARSLPFNVAHIAGNVVFCLLIGPPLVRALRRYRRRFEVRWAPAGARPVSSSTAWIAVALGVGVVALAGAPAAEAASSAERAARYLEGSQNRDGGFGAVRGSASAGTQTGEVALGLAAAGRNPHDVSRGGNSIIDWTRRNIGGVRSVGGVERTILVLRAAGTPPSASVSPVDTCSRDATFDELLDHRGRGRLLRWERQPRCLRRAGSACCGRGSGVGARAENRSPGSWSSRRMALRRLRQASALRPRRRAAPTTRGPRCRRWARPGGVAGPRLSSPSGIWLTRKTTPAGFGLTDGGEPNAQSTAWSVQGLVAVGRGRELVARCARLPSEKPG